MQPLLVIIAGGANKSFRPLATNKTLFPFMGKPLIQYTLEMAKRAGFNEILVATSEENDAWISSYTLEGVIIKTKKQAHSLGMADALLTLEDLIQDRPIVVKSAADMVDDELLRLVLEKSSSYAVVPGIKVKENFPGGYLKTDGDRAVGIVEKPAAGQEPSDLVILTAHYFSQPMDFFALLKKIPPSESDDVYEQALTKLMQNQTVQYVTYQGNWKKLKHCYHVLDVMQLILSTQVHSYMAQGADVSQKASLHGEIY